MKFLLIGKSVHPYWDEVRLGAEAAAKKYNVEFEFFLPRIEEPSFHRDAIMKALQSKIDGISFGVSFPEKIKDLVEKAVRDGIPCIAMDTDAPQTARLLYIGTNNVMAGKMAAENLARLINWEGDVAVCAGSYSALNVHERVSGFKEGLVKYQKINIVEENEYGDDELKASSAAQSVLLRRQNLGGIFAVMGVNGSAVGRALKTSGKLGKVKVVAFDATPEHMGFLKEGIFHVLIGQRPYMTGFKSIETLYRMRTSGVERVMKYVPPSKMIDTGVDVVTLDTLDSYRSFLVSLGVPVRF